MRGISWLAVNQLAAQEWLCTMEWVREVWVIHFIFPLKNVPLRSVLCACNKIVKWSEVKWSANCFFRDISLSRKELYMKILTNRSKAVTWKWNNVCSWRCSSTILRNVGRTRCYTAKDWYLQQCRCLNPVSCNAESFHLFSAYTKLKKISGWFRFVW